VATDRSHIALVGLSGTGKSTVGPLLARRRGLVAVDVDRSIAQAAGTTVAALFDELGEEGFRDLEARVLGDALDGAPAVIATGGGAVLRPENRTRLARQARTVWLRADLEVLVERLGRSRERRPLLADDAATALRRIAAEREPLYREVADLVVDVGTEGPAEIAERVDRELPA
jgi:shikimate kinase